MSGILTISFHVGVVCFTLLMLLFCLLFMTLYRDTSNVDIL